MARTRRAALRDESEEERERKEFDILIDFIQNVLEEEDEKAYSREVVAEFRNPTHAGRMEDASCSGVADGLCKDTMEVYLKVESNRIRQCSFYTDGCGASVACGNRLARYVEGMDLISAWSVKPIDIMTMLNGLPREHEHCAALAVLALRNALRDLEGQKKKVKKRSKK
jgi:nitrogen fixation NifU-like protein